MTVRTLEEEPPKTVRLPGWYLDAAVRPGQSRRVDLAYARTDMRSQGRTERRALLALNGAEDMQGGYVQLTRSKQRTDLYLTVGPEPLGPDDERPHPAREPWAPEELLARVLARDGSKTLATDTPDVPDVRRLSTAELRAERDRLARLRAECPPDRSRELRLATQRAREAEQVCQQARADQQAAAEQVAALAGTWRRREWPGPGSGWCWPTMPCAPPAARLTKPPSGWGSCGGPSSGTWAGWKPTTTSCGSASGRWPGRLPGGAGSTSTRWPWTRRIGCWPSSAPFLPTQASGWCGGWRPRNWMAIGAPTAWITLGRRSIVGGERPGTGGRLRRPLGPAWSRPAGAAGSRAAAAAPPTPLAAATTGSGRP
jgi:hypothetical protein